MVKVLIAIGFLLGVLFGAGWVQARSIDGQSTGEKIIVLDGMSADEIRVLQEELQAQGLERPLKWACYAENRYSEVFRGVDDDQRLAEQKAMARCYRWSRSCYSTGCEPIILVPF